MVDKQGYGPDLVDYMDKKLEIKMNGNRKILGVLRGYDNFMNLVLENCSEVDKMDKKKQIGTVMIRGNSILMWECIDRIK